MEWYCKNCGRRYGKNPPSLQCKCGALLTTERLEKYRINIACFEKLAH